ncbi:MAG TPA: branched-chain amino acid ABC transporter permease [Burkholderiaceae bacterium]|jgi:branched-chain amino acid transport system permease protein|nr:branched-chain amino acid ABC transporter permease [Burkholderiaceae bacterium]
MDITSLLIQVLNAVQYGLLLFLVASGLTLVFGMMRIINLAHGSFYMLGAYAAFVLTRMTGSLPLAIALGVPLALAFGAALEWLLFARLYRRDHLEQVLLTYGLILIFEDLRSLAVGDDVHGVPIPALLRASIALNETLSYPVYRIAVSVACIAIAAGLTLLIRRTRLGMMIRAGSHDRDMIQSLGVNIDLLYRIVFALGVALAALAGMLAAPISSVFPDMGSQVLIVSFVIVVIGGIGSVWGAFLASLLVGFADTFGKVLLPDFAGLAVYGVMATALLLRPQGIFGKKVGS